MTLARFRSQNHPQQTASNGARDSIDDRATTAEVFEPLNDEFGPFTVDVAASANNTKVPAKFYTRTTDGLRQPWTGERVWCNPPYSSIEPWIRKAWAETSSHGCERVVMLLPANRTEQTWWQDLVEPYRDRPGSGLTTRFLRGRLRFLMPGQTTIPPDSRPPFGCVLLIFEPGTEPTNAPAPTLLEMPGAWS